jgi:hypothetical protein
MTTEINGVFIKRRQPREHAVLCPLHKPTAPVRTWNFSGKCDEHEAKLRDDKIFETLKEFDDESA